MEKTGDFLEKCSEDRAGSGEEEKVGEDEDMHSR